MWRKAQSLAASAVADENTHRHAGAAALLLPSMAQNPAAKSQASAAADGSDGYSSPDRAAAISLGQQAVAQANAAIHQVVEEMGTVGESVGALGPALKSAAATGNVGTVQIDAALAAVNNPSDATLRTSLEKLLNDPKKVSQSDIGQLIDQLQKLSGDQRGRLSDALANSIAFQHLGAALRDEQPQSLWDSIFGGGDPPVSSQQMLQLQSFLMANASKDTVQALAKLLPNVDPSLSGVSHWNKANDRYGSSDQPVIGSGGPSPSDVFQGGVGDCYFLASLIAVAQRDPSFLQKHFKDNGNGTATVTLYQNGKPVDVTVTDTVPISTNPNVQWLNPPQTEHQGTPPPGPTYTRRPTPSCRGAMV